MSDVDLLGGRDSRLVEAREDRFGGVTEGIELFRGKTLDKEASHRRHVTGRGGLELPAATGGDDDVDPAAVRVALLLLHQAPLDHPANVMRGAAILPAEHPSELEQPHASV